MCVIAGTGHSLYGLFIQLMSDASLCVLWVFDSIISNGCRMSWQVDRHALFNHLPPVHSIAAHICQSQCREVQKWDQISDAFIHETFIHCQLKARRGSKKMWPSLPSGWDLTGIGRQAPRSCTVAGDVRISGPQGIYDMPGSKKLALINWAFSFRHCWISFHLLLMIK